MVFTSVLVQLRYKLLKLIDNVSSSVNTAAARSLPSLGVDEDHDRL